MTLSCSENAPQYQRRRRVHRDLRNISRLPSNGRGGACSANESLHLRHLTAGIVDQFCRRDLITAFASQAGVTGPNPVPPTKPKRSWNKGLGSFLSLRFFLHVRLLGHLGQSWDSTCGAAVWNAIRETVLWRHSRSAASFGE